MWRLCGRSNDKGSSGGRCSAAHDDENEILQCGFQKLREYLKTHVEEFSRLVHNQDLLNGTEPLAVAGFEKEFQKAKAEGEIQIPREDILFFETDKPGEFIINTTRIIEHDATNAESLSDAEILGRKQCEQLERFLRKYVPDLNMRCLSLPVLLWGVRGSRQLVGTTR